MPERLSVTNYRLDGLFSGNYYSHHQYHGYYRNIVDNGSYAQINHYLIQNAHFVFTFGKWWE
jgi:hypothetical protein